MLASKGGPGNGGPGLLKEDLGPLREGSDGETSDYQRSTPSPRDADDMVMELNSEGGFLIIVLYLRLCIFCQRSNQYSPHFQLRTSPTVPLHLRRTGEQKRTSLTLDSLTVPTQHPPPPPSPTPPLHPPPTPPSWTATSPPPWRASPPSPPPPPCWASS